MNKSALFKKAHALAKATVKAGDSYSATFALCLKEIYTQANAPKQAPRPTKTIAPKATTLGFEEWVSDYFDLDVALLPFDEVQALRQRYNQTQKVSTANPKAIAKAKAERTTAKKMGMKALKGTPKQKAWAEKIRKEFLLQVTDKDALELAGNSEITAHAKFWIETRNISVEKLANAMRDLVVATRTANAIGAGNDGYNEQLEIRKQAFNVLSI